MAGKVRVLVVEDDNVVRDAIEIALRGEGYDVRSEADGSRLLAVAGDFNPDVAVLDVRLPDGPDGYAMTRWLRERDLPVLLLTAADSLDDKLTGFRAGADDYMGKPFSTAELLARVQVILRHSGKLTTNVHVRDDLVVDDGPRTVTRAGEPVELTRTEYDLLLTFLRHPDQVLTRQGLLVQVWGFDAYDSNVVEVHLGALRRKLEAHGPRIIHTVRGVGYVLRD